MRKLFTLILSLSACAISAQDVTSYTYADAMQLWRNTQNSASLTVDSFSNRGYAEFAFDRTDGSYHRVQEGSSHNEFSFYTERYQTIGKYLYGYGSFRFDMGRTQDRAWADQIRTYNSNPFITGSSVPGKYDNQDFQLTARLATVSLSGWRLGAGLDYSVGDLSRLRDPRSRARLLDYKLSPAISYTTGSNTFGITGWYHRRKEKMPTLTTVQNNPNLYYYQMSGLDAFTGTIGGYTGFQREYVNHELGAELEYGYQSEAFRSVNAVSILRGTDNIYEQYKREPGRYYTYKYGVSSQNRIVTSRLIHQFDLKANYEQSYADEYRPQMVITIDSLTGHKSYAYENLMTYAKRYQLTALDVSLHYRANFVRSNAVKSYLGLQADFNSISQKHLLPLSTFDLSTLGLNAEYGQALLPSNSLWLTLDLGYLISSKADISLSNPDGDYAREVLLKDMDYYRANCFRGKLSVMYQLPVVIKKSRTMLYAKAYYQTVQAQNHLSGNSFGISLGTYY